MLWFQNKTLILKALVWQFIAWIVALLLLFGMAGTWTWLTGWIFFVLFFGTMFWLYSWLCIVDPDLLTERLSFFHAAQLLWDRIFL